MAEPKEPQAGAPNNDNQPVALRKRTSRMAAAAVSASVFVAIGSVAIYILPKYDIALPNFSSLVELLPSEAASASIPDTVVTSALKDIQSSQQQNAAALQENAEVLKQTAAALQQGTASLDSLRQSFAAQQADLKKVSNQLSSLMARVDALQNAVLTTSSIPQPKARARIVRTSTKNTSRLPKPLGPVSVGGAPLSLPAPPLGSGSG